MYDIKCRLYKVFVSSGVSEFHKLFSIMHTNHIQVTVLNILSVSYILCHILNPYQTHTSESKISQLILKNFLL